MRLLLLLLAAPAVLASLDWHLSEGDSEESLVDYMADVEAEELKRNHASLAAQKGWWSAAAELTRLSALHGLDIDNELSMAARTIEGSISKLRKLARDSRPVSSTAIAPAHEWAQSPDSVFVNIKYAHKLDAPAAIGVKTDVVDIQPSHVKVTATHPNKHFLLDLPLAGEVVPEKSTWSESSVGRMTLILRKAEVNSTWTGLVQGKKPANSHIWWVMKEQHEDAMEAAEDFVAAQKKKARADAAKAKSLEEGPSGSLESDGSSDSDGSAESAAPAKPEVSALDKALEEARKRMDKEAKAQVKALEDDARSQKRQVDEEAKAKKKAIDKDVAQRRAELKKAAAEAKAAELERVRSSSSLSEEL